MDSRSLSLLEKTGLSMTRANIWPPSPGAVLPWLPSLPSRKLCEILVDSMCTDLEGEQSEAKNLLDRAFRLYFEHLMVHGWNDWK
jgi:hypothetical protein